MVRRFKIAPALIAFFLTLAPAAVAQSAAKPAAKDETGFTSYASFEGTSDSDGQAHLRSTAVEGGGSMGPGASRLASGANHGNMSSSNSGSAHGVTANQILSKNTALASKIQTLTGMPSQKACSGFKNLGQCVAAAHVSKNLGISFGCMQADMTGQPAAKGSACPAGTGSKSLSLGKTIQTLDPKADSKLESKKATKQADADIKDSETHS